MIIGDKNIDRNLKSLREILLRDFRLKKFVNVYFSTAFFTDKAVEQLSDILKIYSKRNISKSCNITILLGTKNYFTRPHTIRKLFRLKKRFANKNININILFPNIREFHIKCYYFERINGKKYCYVGSANLTDNGLACNGELIVKITDEVQVAEINDYMQKIIKNSLRWENCFSDYKRIYRLQKNKINNI